MQFTRSLAALVVTPFLTLLVSLATLIDLTLFRKSPKKTMGLVRAWGRIVCGIIGIHVTIEGLENINPDQTYIFAANHVSQVDIIVFQAYFPHDYRWIAKKELFKIPIFGPAMRRADFIPIDRSHGRQALKSLIEAAKRIAAGTSVLIFPEGTRSSSGKLQPFKTGTVLLAIKSKVDIVPIGFIGTHDILPKGKLLAKPGTVIIRVGTPISTRDYTPKQKKEFARELHNRVSNLLSTDKS